MEIIMAKLQAQWALVTGASRGIGRQMAEALADAGVNVVVHSRDLKDTRDLVADLQGRGVEAFAVAGELSDPQTARAVAQEVVGKVDLTMLFNNAGVQPPSMDSYWQADPEAYARTYAVNLVAPAVIISEVVPGMLARGYGRILNTSSGIADQPEQGAYAASKGALNKFTKDFAAKLAGSGVTMNVTDPGWIRTDMGGENAPNAVSTTTPGMIVGGFLPESVNGKWLSAQDFAGLGLEEAVKIAPEKVKELAVTV
jgi:3-oxoacyl-[acyl-carrier protein] reductase